MTSEKSTVRSTLSENKRYVSITVNGEFVGIARPTDVGFIPSGCRRASPSIEDAALRLIDRNMNILCKKMDNLNVQKTLIKESIDE